MSIDAARAAYPAAVSMGPVSPTSAGPGGHRPSRGTGPPALALARAGRHVVPQGPAPARQPGAARRHRGRPRRRRPAGRAALRRRSGAMGHGRSGSAGLPRRVPARPWTRASAGGLLIRHGVARRPSSPRSSPRPVRPPSTSARTSRRTASPATRRSRRRSGPCRSSAPGRPTRSPRDGCRKEDDTAYRVFTPFYRGWVRHGWRAPAGDVPSDVEWWMPLECQGFPAAPDLDGLVLPDAGEEAAWTRGRPTATAGSPATRTCATGPTWPAPAR